MNHPDLLSRFLSYVAIDTQSQDEVEDFPSTAKQLHLASKLKGELQDLGITDVVVNQWGYLLATLPTNRPAPQPTIALMAHFDTSPDVSGENVKPVLHRDYDGQDLPVSADGLVTLRIADHPYLATKVGHTVITSDGSTLLGADDKAGIAEIMDLLTYLVTHPEFPRPTLRIVFTPDEEVGRGVDHLTVAEIGADYGYTVDGEKVGEIEDETFCADSVDVKITGINVHPGQAKDKLVNAVKVAAAIVELFPRDALSPETTAGREGYIHPHHLTGSVETAVIKILIRDFTPAGLVEKEDYIRGVVAEVLARYPGAKAEVLVHESYRNMKVVLDRYPQVIEKAIQAIRASGLQPIQASIRGGTDGARLSFMGLPTPNLFSGGNSFHSKYEWITLEDMGKAVEVLRNLVRLWSEG